MADVPASRIMVTNIASSSGAAVITICVGTLPYQTCLMTFPLTATQNAAMQVALAAAAGTTTNFDFAAGTSSTLGITNTV